jgi:hypothetical protein
VQKRQQPVCLGTTDVYPTSTFDGSSLECRNRGMKTGFRRSG